jgi:hypothetical protein
MERQSVAEQIAAMQSNWSGGKALLMLNMKATFATTINEIMRSGSFTVRLHIPRSTPTTPSTLKCEYVQGVLHQTVPLSHFSNSLRDGSPEIVESISRGASLDLNAMPMNDVSLMLPSKTCRPIPSSLYPSPHLQPARRNVSHEPTMLQIASVEEP